MNFRSFLRFCARLFLIRRKLVFEADLDDIRQAEARMPVRFRAGAEADLVRLSQAMHDYDPPAVAFAIERLDAGDSLTVAESRKDIVFYSWLMFGQLDMGMRRYLRIAADTATVYRVFTIATCRGRRLAAGWFWWIREQLRESDVRRLVAWVEARNVASRRAFESAGFHQIGCIWHVQFLFHVFLFVSPSLRARLRRQAAIESAPAPAPAA